MILLVIVSIFIPPLTLSSVESGVSLTSCDECGMANTPSNRYGFFK